MLLYDTITLSQYKKQESEIISKRDKIHLPLFMIITLGKKELLVVQK
jgi:hypothetical protein